MPTGNLTKWSADFMFLESGRAKAGILDRSRWPESRDAYVVVTVPDQGSYTETVKLARELAFKFVKKQNPGITPYLGEITLVSGP